MNKETFTNPILSGFYPDPSICRVGEDYYLVTSSFVYFPGLPIFHSKDLVHWEQIGHAIHSIEQLDYKNCETSLGLWAPTIRYNNDIYYIINTFISEGREARRDNFIVTAANPSGPWSQPIFIEGADGIDPTIFFDEDGSVWYVGNRMCDPLEYEGHHAIYLTELDSITLQIKGPRVDIWNGNQSRSKWIEAPHIYKRGEWYYLMVAEGGTFTNHSVMMARSKTIQGNYEICPRNPIVTHRHLSLMSEISVVGHADIVETQKGEWWMVLLGVRPYEGKHYNLGRETFMIPIIWEEDGWLRVDNASGLVNKEERLPNLSPVTYPKQNPNDQFESDHLALIWNSIHQPNKVFYSLKERRGYLRLYLQPEVIQEICSPAFIGRRQQHKYFQATTAMEFKPNTQQEEAGLVLLSDDRFNYVYVIRMKGEARYLQLYKTELGQRVLIKELQIDTTTRLYLTIQGNETTYAFYFGYEEHVYTLFAENIEASLLSSTVNEGFTGTYIGMYGSTNKTDSMNHADFDWFNYYGN